MRSEAWRPAAAARNRSPREAGTPPSRHYDLGARRSLHGSKPAEASATAPKGDGSAAPGAQNRHGGAPRGERPASWDARRLARRLACRVMCRPNGCRCTRTFLGAPPTPRFGVSEAKLQNPGRKMRRGKEKGWKEKGCLKSE